MPEKVEDKNNDEYMNLYYSSLSSNKYIKFTYCIYHFILTHSVAHLFLNVNLLNQKKMPCSECI